MIPAGLFILSEIGANLRDSFGLHVLGAKLKAEEDDAKESKEPKRSLTGIP